MMNLLLIIPPSKNTRYISSDNIAPSTEATKIPTLPPYFASKYFLDNTIQDMFDRSDEIFYQSDKIFDKQHEELKNIENELVNIKLETPRLSEDTSVIK